MRAAFDGVEHHVIEMLLELYVAEQGNRRLSVSALATTAGLRQTTGLRWITFLERSGHVVRHSDPRDKRRCWVLLSDEARGSIEQLVRQWGAPTRTTPDKDGEHLGSHFC